MFFSPSRAIAEFMRKIKDHWGISRKVYWLCINGKHESQVCDWPEESSVAIKIKGKGGRDPPATSVKIHLKIPESPKIYEVNIGNNAAFENVATLPEDLFESLDGVKLFYEGFELALQDGVQEWLT
jgi:hypothetical protein